MDSTTTGGDFLPGVTGEGFLSRGTEGRSGRLTIIKDQLGLKLRIAVEVRMVSKI